ncbi:P-loop containing nucleoside triphosphate hydrolase protein [Phascolomyces articulosus]|uniref:P-loop containing nucleoside triphosphate hydrolase protein n=1 Tax=Phascolomyces articulosus TaxID=60185 RepID=A0AAD5PEK1_9FUNG|nr:P-loop containing nucleoside triphosphate hydrolase protein [Phascolomyces articulosus]
MAPLQVIGASWGRTGTNSLKEALAILGFRTHHMRAMYENTESHPDIFKEAYENPNQPVDWDVLYSGFDAAVDWPTVSFLDRLIKYYPDAKIILTLRDTESWYASFKNTIVRVLESDISPADTSNNALLAKQVREMVRTLILDGLFKDPERNKTRKALNDYEEDMIKEKYEAHIEWVKQNVPSERLFIMELGEEWDRLCNFLNKSVPKDIPYPHTNTRKAFIEKFQNSAKDFHHEQ